MHFLSALAAACFFQGQLFPCFLYEILIVEIQQINILFLPLLRMFRTCFCISDCRCHLSARRIMRHWAVFSGTLSFSFRSPALHRLTLRVYRSSFLHLIIRIPSRSVRPVSGRRLLPVGTSRNSGLGHWTLLSLSFLLRVSHILYDPVPLRSLSSF